MLEYILGAVLLIVLYFQWKGSFWQRRNVKGPQGGLPIVGNMLDFVLTKTSYGEVYDQIYFKFGQLNYVGIYRIFNEPAILIRDLDLIKDILVRNFSTFHDNYFNIDERIDPLSGKNPFIATGENWKVFRNQIAPIFTPSKVKATFPYINNVCEKFEEYIGAFDEKHFEAKELCSRYTLQVVACCAFGLDAQTFTNNDSDFIKLCDKLFQPHFWSLLQTINLLFTPIVGKIVKLPYVPESVQDWLRTITTETIKHREKTIHEKRTDFLQFILDLRTRGEKINDATIVGHATTFLFEGFETSSTLMAFCLYELSINSEIQENVYKEISKVIKKYEGKFTFEGLQEMTYLESVLLETLRMHPGMSTLLKVCNKEYQLPAQYSGGMDVNIPAGTTMVLPVSAIHNDPLIYPEPKIFRPERFNEENLSSRNKYAFLAFGEGSRMCIGMKFGLAQSKAGLVTILGKYKVNLSPKMITPIKKATTTFLLGSKDGIFIELTERESLNNSKNTQ